MKESATVEVTEALENLKKTAIAFFQNSGPAKNIMRSPHPMLTLLSAANEYGAAVMGDSYVGVCGVAEPWNSGAHSCRVNTAHEVHVCRCGNVWTKAQAQSWSSFPR